MKPSRHSRYAVIACALAAAALSLAACERRPVEPGSPQATSPLPVPPASAASR